MRKLVIILLASAAVLLIILLVIYIKSRNIGSLGDTPESEPEKGKSDEVSDNTNNTKDPGVESLQVGNYKASWIIVDNPEKIFLYSNLEKKDSAKDLRLAYDCNYLINASFFDESDNHIGLFLKDGDVISQFQENQLFNGIFSVSAGNDQIISKKPIYPARIAVQSGPMLMFQSRKLTHLSQNEENARRIVVATQNDGSAVFMVIYGNNNLFFGPKLSELPEILKNINDMGELAIDNALNLDGGAHSAFFSDKLTLTELSNIGGFFCVRP